MTTLGSASYFNQVAEEYMARYDAETPGGYALRIRQQRVLELLDARGGKALDIGCGPGRMAPDLISRGYEFWGVDAAPAMIELCKQQFGSLPGTHFSVSDARKLLFEDNHFDCVICMGVIDRIGDWESAIAEMVRVLKPGGVLIISFPNLLSPYAWWKNFVFYPVVALLRFIYYRLRKRLQPPSLYNRVNPRGHVSLLASFAKLQALHVTTGFLAQREMQGTNVVYYNFNMLLSPLDEIFPNVSLMLSDKLERLRFGRLRSLGAGFIIKARKLG